MTGQSRVVRNSAPGANNNGRAVVGTRDAFGCGRGAVGVEGELRLVMAGNRLWQRRETGTAGSRCRACHMTFV